MEGMECKRFGYAQFESDWNINQLYYSIDFAKSGQNKNLPYWSCFIILL